MCIRSFANAEIPIILCINLLLQSLDCLGWLPNDPGPEVQPGTEGVMNIVVTLATLFDQILMTVMG
jgi:hypothetical protein